MVAIWWLATLQLSTKFTFNRLTVSENGYDWRTTKDKSLEIVMTHLLFPLFLYGGSWLKRSKGLMILDERKSQIKNQANVNPF